MVWLVFFIGIVAASLVPQPAKLSMLVSTVRMRKGYTAMPKAQRLQVIKEQLTKVNMPSDWKASVIDCVAATFEFHVSTNSVVKSLASSPSTDVLLRLRIHMLDGESRLIDVAGKIICSDELLKLIKDVRAMRASIESMIDKLTRQQRKNMLGLANFVGLSIVDFRTPVRKAMDALGLQLSAKVNTATLCETAAAKAMRAFQSLFASYADVAAELSRSGTVRWHSSVSRLVASPASGHLRGAALRALTRSYGSWILFQTESLIGNTFAKLSHGLLQTLLFKRQTSPKGDEEALIRSVTARMATVAIRQSAHDTACAGLKEAIGIQESMDWTSVNPKVALKTKYDKARERYTRASAEANKLQSEGNDSFAVIVEEFLKILI